MRPPTSSSPPLRAARPRRLGVAVVRLDNGRGQDRRRREGRRRRRGRDEGRAGARPSSQRAARPARPPGRSRYHSAPGSSRAAEGGAPRRRRRHGRRGDEALRGRQHRPARLARRDRRRGQGRTPAEVTYSQAAVDKLVKRVAAHVQRDAEGRERHSRRRASATVNGQGRPRAEAAVLRRQIKKRFDPPGARATFRAKRRSSSRRSRPTSSPRSTRWSSPSTAAASSSRSTRTSS